jgi:hypothetical protein
MGRKKLKGKQLSEDTKQKRWATHYGYVYGSYGEFISE